MEENIPDIPVFKSGVTIGDIDLILVQKMVKNFIVMYNALEKIAKGHISEMTSAGIAQEALERINK
uniref:Uncharacterized protein n=1 Tax=viral metagenome TaxID=1070528 RepID=A0A6M3XUA9_9ZZZZ